MQIKNIIFDLGQVLLTLNFNATKQAFEAAGFTNHSIMFGKYSGSEAFHKFETGHLTAEAFYAEVKHVANMPQLSNQTILNAWNAMLGHVPLIRLQLLKKLKQHYKLLLYSNTNELHYNCFNTQFKSDYPNQNLNNYFNAVYYSHIFGYRKPNPQSFEKLLKAENILAHETLFIDDGEANINGAKSIGLHTLLINDNVTIENNLEQYLLQLN